jgi:hypothetical protein
MAKGIVCTEHPNALVYSGRELDEEGNWTGPDLYVCTINWRDALAEDKELTEALRVYAEKVTQLWNAKTIHTI